MKNLVYAFIWLLPITAVAADKQASNPADYTITVHVVAAYVRSQQVYGAYLQYQQLKAVIDGKNVELSGGANGVLVLGDYKAKVVPTPHAPKNPPNYEVYLTYEFIFPDGKTQQYTFTGLEATNGPTQQP